MIFDKFDHLRSPKKGREVHLVIKNLSVKYDTKKSNFALDCINLTIEKGTLLTIIGGSGCGKTTLLKAIAGFTQVENGSIILDGEDITHLEPYNRNVGMVFQSYYLFPHMTVRENVAFGLKNEGVSNYEIEQEVSSMLNLMQISDYADRYPNQISGGQKQRVALARSLVMKPAVLLLDEPHAALDDKLKSQMQLALMKIQEERNITCINASHDQEEAMIISDSIAVMRDGKIIQKGTPIEIYEFPQSDYIAEFVGETNILECQVYESKESGYHTCFATEINTHILVPQTSSISSEVQLAIRPEKILISKSSLRMTETYNHVTGIVTDMLYYGATTTYRVSTATGYKILCSILNSTRKSYHNITWDDHVHLYWKPEDTAIISLSL